MKVIVIYDMRFGNKGTIAKALDSADWEELGV
jgi:hypothetical protein